MDCWHRSIIRDGDVLEHVLIGLWTDERALVEGARQLGFVFSIRTPQDVTVSTVNILCTMKFSVAVVVVLILLAVVETSGGIALGLKCAILLSVLV